MKSQILGSVRNLVDANEDTQNIYDYYAFGKELGSWTENVTNRYTYTAREYDTESEQYYYRARYYDGGGRFNRRDPVWQGNPYLYCGNDPIMRSDATGMYGSDLHRDATTRWAQQLEFSGISASMIGEADIGVDSLKNKTNWAPVIGDQSYHFNRNPGGIDTRLRHHTNHRAKAKYLCWKECKPREAAKQLGIALHPLQDWVAHGDYAINNPGGIWWPHNYFSTQTNIAGDVSLFPDRIDLDAVGGPSGRPAGAAMIGTGPQAYAWYVRGTQRLTLVTQLTKDSLINFKTFIEQKGCCECKLFFLGD